MWSLLLLALCSTALALNMKEPPPPVAASPSRATQELWYTARLDNFDASNTDTFPMRFYYNDDVAYNGNVVIYVGGEWSISAGWVQAGLAYEVATLAGAGMFYTEHRFYGLTRPTEDTSTASLRYLTVDQALADLAQFIGYIRSDQFENGRYKDGRVALVGCSYAGSMATWMKLAYPHHVDVAFSDSGPLHAQEDFPEYLEVITEVLRSQGGETCVQNIELAMERVTELLQTAAGAQQVSEMFNTCTTISAQAPLDMATFFWFGITETFAGLVQYAVPGDVEAACAVINSTTVADPAQRLANWITSQSWTQPCIESRYSEIVAGHTNTSYDSPDAVMRLWTYQTCVEYGWYQTTSSTHQPFLSAVPLEYFHQMCMDFFGNAFDESLLRAGIERTNLFFAGLEFMPDNVVSVAGAADPWSPMGPNRTHETPLSPVHVVPDISHCRTIRPITDNESDEVYQTKLAVRAFLASGLGVEMPSSSGHQPSVRVAWPIILLGFAAALSIGHF